MIGLLLLTPFLFAVGSIGIRVFQLHFQNRRCAIWVFQGAYCIVATIAYATQIRQAPDAGTAILAAIFGVFFFLATRNGARSYELGPMSLTSVISNSSLLIPTLVSVFVWNEVLTVRQIIGIVLLFATFIISANSEKNGGKVNLRWICVVFVAFLANGCTATLQKFQEKRAVETGSAFLCIAYGTAALCLAGYSLYKYVRTDPSEPKVLFRGNPWLLAGLTVASGLGSFGGNLLMQILCTKINGGIMYPVINGGLCVIVSLAAFFLFREKPTVRKCCAIVTGLAGIIILTI